MMSASPDSSTTIDVDASDEEMARTTRIEKQFEVLQRLLFVLYISTSVTTSYLVTQFTDFSYTALHTGDPTAEGIAMLISLILCIWIPCVGGVMYVFVDRYLDTQKDILLSR